MASGLEDGQAVDPFACQVFQAAAATVPYHWPCLPKLMGIVAKNFWRAKIPYIFCRMLCPWKETNFVNPCLLRGGGAGAGGCSYMILSHPWLKLRSC